MAPREDPVRDALIREFKAFDYDHRKRIRERHYCRDDGMCAECSIGVTSEVWPCVLVQLLKDSRRPGERWQ